MSGKHRKTTPQTPVPGSDAAAAQGPVPTQADNPARAAVMPQLPETPVKGEMAKTKKERIGDILRNARLERGDDIYYIADYLRIKPAFLVALENSQYDEFPADAYVIGFLRSYATLLGLDGKAAVDRYRYEMAGRRKKPTLAMPPPLSEGRAPSALIMVGATIAALLIYALWYGISSSNRTEVSTPVLPTVQRAVPAATDDTATAGLTAPVSSITQPESKAPVIPQAAPGIMVAGSVPAPESLAKDTSVKDMTAKDTTPKTATTDTSPSPSGDDKNTKDGGKVYGNPGEASSIVIRATQSSWIMVTDAEGKAVFDHVLKPGDVYKVPNQPGLSLTTGNGSGIILSLNGNDLPKIASGAPHVVRGIPLDPARLTTMPSDQ